MSSSFVHSIDALAAWRAALAASLDGLMALLREHELFAEPAADLLGSLRQQVAGDKLVVAFVAEFSRGKSELINAMLFADSGRRILPATPGRTTMCPVELAWDAAEPTALSLLPIESRLDGLPLADLRRQPAVWHTTPLALDDADALALALQRVTQTRAVDIDTARRLGFWDDVRPDDRPPLTADGTVEIPAWRHARINLPHPLLQQGLVVLDTPGLNAIGAEPELTVGLLPTAHATVFVLGADTGVTKSDLAVWRDHLSAPGIARYAVLNKIDTLADPMGTARDAERQIARQCSDVARSLQLPPERVFPLSARQALHARATGDAAGLAASRLPALESALAQRVLPQRREQLAQRAGDALAQTETQVLRQLTDRRCLLAEQLLELRGLRGKNASKVQLMLQRVDAEAAEFEQCTARLLAIRAVHARMLRGALHEVAGERLREHVGKMRDDIHASLLQLGAKKAFVTLCAELKQRLVASARQIGELHQMLTGSFGTLNSDHGFSLQLSAAPSLQRAADELDLIERNYAQYLGLTHALKLQQSRFLDQFRRMLVSRLRTVFETAGKDLEAWSRGASSQIDAQLQERRQGFQRRREALERIRTAAGDLEGRLAELEADDAQLLALQQRVADAVHRVRRHAGDAMPARERPVLRGAAAFAV